MQELLSYRQQHTEVETQEHFGLTREALRLAIREAKKEIPDNTEMIKSLAQEFLESGLNKTQFAEVKNIPGTTLRGHLKKAKSLGFMNLEEQAKTERLERENKKLRTQVKAYREDDLTTQEIREKVYKLSSQPADPPKWVLTTDKLSKGSPGTPSLFISDIHYGEVVDPLQINGVNAYSVAIAEARLKMLVENTIDLLNNHMVNPNYPGIVVPTGGDLFSGDIHDELSITNELEIMTAFSRLFGCMIEVYSNLADSFGKVFIPWVSGNHPRTTKKIRAKNFNATNFDYLLGLQLEKHFEKDNRIQFYIPAGTDALYRIFDYRYLLTHGNQFRGGDGMIGPIGPIIRGDYKKRGRNTQIDMEYDTLLIGHFHQVRNLGEIIVNGSLKGYDEYCYTNNFKYEAPKQILFMTHPDRDITFSMPVQLIDKKKKITSEWVGWVK
jgi:hypothetical protein